MTAKNSKLKLIRMLTQNSKIIAENGFAKIPVADSEQAERILFFMQQTEIVEFEALRGISTYSADIYQMQEVCTGYGEQISPTDEKYYGPNYERQQMKTGTRKHISFRQLKRTPPDVTFNNGVLAIRMNMIDMAALKLALARMLSREVANAYRTDLGENPKPETIHNWLVKQSAFQLAGLGAPAIGLLKAFRRAATTPVTAKPDVTQNSDALEKFNRTIDEARSGLQTAFEQAGLPKILGIAACKEMVGAIVDKAFVPSFQEELTAV